MYGLSRPDCTCRCDGMNNRVTVIYKDKDTKLQTMIWGYKIQLTMARLSTCNSNRDVTALTAYSAFTVHVYSTICKFKSKKRGVYNVINVWVLPSKPRTRQTHQRVEERE